MKKFLVSGLIIACLATPALADKAKLLFILSGQSNMRRPLPDEFKRVVERVYGADNVIVVTHAHPSQPIRQWYKKWSPPEGMASDDKPNGKLYDALLSKVKRAVGERELATVTFVWMQGEADAGAGWGAVYRRSFLGVLDQFKEDLGIGQINFVIGRINDHYLDKAKDGHVVRAVQVKLGDDHANGAWVNTDDLNMGVNPWGVYSLADGHFPPAGYRVMGERFAAAACRLIDPNIRFDDGVFTAAFMDSPSQVQTHAAIDRPVTGTAPAQREGAAALRVLTDGMFGSTHPGDGKWVAVPPESTAEWVIDLGGETEAASVAVSMLINRQRKAGFAKMISLAVSSDGADYHLLINRKRQPGVKFGYKDALRQAWAEQLAPQSVLALVEKQFTARYIKVTAEAAEDWLYIDEILINPQPGKAAIRVGG